MGAGDGEAPRWNVFAAELEAILRVRGHGMTNLYHAGIYRELVRRLRRSLREPGTFPVLNPAELDRIAFHYQLSPAEIWRLRAAVLATAAERLLYGRIGPTDALRAARELLPVLDEAVRLGRVAQVWRHDDADGASLNEETGATADSPETNEESLDLPMFLASAAADALEALDDATLALQMSAQSHPQRERVRWAGEAVRQFTMVQNQLVQMDAEVRASTAWGDWEAETRQGLNASADRLLELTEGSNTERATESEAPDSR